MTVLFPQKYPDIVSRIITLDNRRMAFPKDRNLKIYSLRSSDQPADEGVIPVESDLKKRRMTIIRLPDVKHNDMDDDANAEQRKEIQNYIWGFLND